MDKVPTPTGVWGPILEYGLLGSLFILLLWYAYKTTKALNRSLERRTTEIQGASDKRTLDAQKVTQQLLDLNNKWNETINHQVVVVKAQTEAFREIKSVLERLRDKMSGCSHNTGGL